MRWSGTATSSTGCASPRSAQATPVVGYAFPRGRTYLLITLLWFVPTIGADISWFVTGWDPWDTAREDPYCDPCVAPSFGFFYIVFALPLVAAGHGLRRLDRRHARRVATALANRR